MRHFLKLILIWTVICLAGTAGIAWAGPEPRVMDDEVFAMLSKGFKDLTQSKFDAAQSEYEKIIKSDFDNPYANNNMAVLMEKQGKLIEAMTYLNIGKKFAEQYFYKVDTAYLIGGVGAAVNPEKATGEKSEIAQIITENQKKLTEKMGSEPAGIPANSGKR